MNETQLDQEANNLFDKAAMPLARIQGHTIHVLSAAIEELARLKPDNYLIPLLAKWQSEMLGEIAQAQAQIRQTQKVLRNQ